MHPCKCNVSLSLTFSFQGASCPWNTQLILRNVVPTLMSDSWFRFPRKCINYCGNIVDAHNMKITLPKSGVLTIPHSCKELKCSSRVWSKVGALHYWPLSGCLPSNGTNYHYQRLEAEKIMAFHLAQGNCDGRVTNLIWCRHCAVHWYVLPY